MRATRFGYLFFALYVMFVGGAYYGVVFPVRVFHHALLTVLMSVWLVARVRRGQGVPFTPLNRPIYAAGVVWFVSALLSIDPRMALEQAWFLVVHMFLFFALVDAFQRGRQRQVFETQFLVAALVVIVSGVELASWYFGLGFIPGTAVGWADVIGPGAWLPLRAPRLSLVLGVSTLLAGYTAPLVMLAVGWALTAVRRNDRRVLWVLALAVLVVLVLTFSRGGLISLASALGVFAALRVMDRGRIPARAVGLAALVGGLTLVAGLTVLSLGRASGDAARVDMWRGALAMTADDPLTGVGVGQFGRAFRTYRDPTNVQDKLASAHNLYLNTAAETGVPGVLVGAWLLAAFARAWAGNWRGAVGARKVRLEAAFAALVGMAFHSMVDVFTVTPIVLLIVGLAAYCVVGHRTWQDAPIAPAHWLTAAVMLLVVLGYGAAFVVMDTAQLHYQTSLRRDENAMREIDAAITLDPALHLYRLHAADLLIHPPDVDTREARTALEQALVLEPTWDVGWLNLAALAERDGDYTDAMDYAARARDISPWNGARVHWARLAELDGTQDSQAILASYQSFLDAGGVVRPTFWMETPLRQQAFENSLDTMAIDSAYRQLREIDPARAAALVPALPVTAAEWWVVGQDALVRGDTDAARDAFTRAIALSPASGDLYASRARALLTSDPPAAERELKIAELLGVTFESPNAVRAQMAQTDAERESLLIHAVPPSVSGGEFAAVLYARPATFGTLPEMRVPGPLRAYVAPWYELAAMYEAQGRPDDARNVYRAILEYAPQEADAREAYDRLSP